MKKIISVFIIVFSMLSVIMLSGCSSDAKKYNTVLKYWAENINDIYAKVSAEDLSEGKSVVEARLSAVGINDYEIDTDESDDTLTVKFNRPDNIKAENDEDVINYEGDIANYLTTQAAVTFRPGNEYLEEAYDDNGNPVYRIPSGKTGKVLMDGSMVKSARSEIQQNGDTAEPVVLLEFTAEGTEKFKNLTERYTNKIISIWLDDEMLAAPTVQVPITDGQVIVSGNFTIEEATKLANQIKSGALPFALRSITAKSP